MPAVPGRLQLRLHADLVCMAVPGVSFADSLSGFFAGVSPELMQSLLATMLFSTDMSVAHLLSSKQLTHRL